jgi:hypothetical protein
MRALDCVHDAHEDIHFTAESDEALLEKVRQHRDAYHPEMTDEQIQDHVAANAYDEEAA